MSPVFALVDCNNFYISCELVFQRALANKPAVVLGNNDGCIVARSNAAKALGIAMGAPLWQYRQLVEKYQVVIFSSNYALYQDMSNRVMRVLSSLARHIEVYSIDEAFLDLSDVPPERLTAYGQHIRSQVFRWTGIPVSVGIAPTKVLTKIACEVVKRSPAYGGVLNLLALSAQEVDELLLGMSVEEVWGIGKASAQRLSRYGILTAQGLKRADHIWIRHLLNVAAQRAVLELQGTCCLPLETRAKPRKGLMVALSFGRAVSDLCELEEAVAHYAVRAAEKLREQHAQAGQVSVFIQTNPFDRKAPQYASSVQQSFPFPTAFTPTLVQSAQHLVQQIYRPGYVYKKAGVYLSDLRTEDVLQPDLFGAFDWEEQARQARLMAMVDLANQFWGRDTVFLGAQGVQRDWQMKQRRRSRRYTTRWSELLQVE